ncbi:MAG: hypothetical protein WBV25_09200 [Methylocella sp.]
MDGIETLLPFNRCRCRSRAQTAALSQRPELAIFESIWFGDAPCHFASGLAVYHLAKLEAIMVYGIGTANVA